MFREQAVNQHREQGGGRRLHNHMEILLYIYSDKMLNILTMWEVRYIGDSCDEGYLESKETKPRKCL